MTTHKITLTEAPKGKAHMWLDWGDERMLLGVSGEPLFAAARWLLDNQMAKPEDKIMTQWQGSEHWSMRAPVGLAASKMVAEASKGGIYTIPYRDPSLAASLAA